MAKYTIPKDMIENAMRNAEIESSSLRRDLDIPMVFGKCFGIIGEFWEISRFLVEMTKLELEINPGIDMLDICDPLAGDVRFTPEGRRTLFYFPSFTIVD